MHADREQVVDVIARILGPCVGDAMARTVTKMHIEKLGLAQDLLRNDEIDDLLAALGPGLHVFIGRGQTDTILEAIRSEIAKVRR